MHPLALKSGERPLGTNVHKNVQYFFYDSDESQVEQKL